ncbi:unnamed protein product, partial [Callosobruchus maculatus]
RQSTIAERNSRLSAHGLRAKAKPDFARSRKVVASRDPCGSVCVRWRGKCGKSSVGKRFNFDGSKGRSEVFECDLNELVFRRPCCAGRRFNFDRSKGRSEVFECDLNELMF